MNLKYVAVLLVVVPLLSAAVLYVTMAQGNQPGPTLPSNSASGTSTGSTTVSPTQNESVSSFSSGGQTSRSSIANGVWNFTVVLTPSTTRQGDPVEMLALLTNIGAENQTVAQFATPIVNPSIYAANGTRVWAWDPPGKTWSKMTITSGQTIDQGVSIPTSSLLPGQTYLVEVSPLSISSASNMTVTIQLQVT